MTGEPAARNVFCHLLLLPKALIPDSYSAPASWKAGSGEETMQRTVRGEDRAPPASSSPFKLGSVGCGEDLASGWWWWHVAMTAREDLSKRRGEDMPLLPSLPETLL